MWNDFHAPATQRGRKHTRVLRVRRIKDDVYIRGLDQHGNAVSYQKFEIHVDDVEHLVFLLRLSVAGPLGRAAIEAEYERTHGKAGDMSRPS